MPHAVVAMLARPTLGPSHCHNSQKTRQHPKIADGLGFKSILNAFTASALILSISTGHPMVAQAMEGIKIEPGVNASEQYFQTVPQGLDTEDSRDNEKNRPIKLSTYLEGPKGKEIQQCARRCTSTCIRGGQGAPGIGPMALRKEVVVFKPGYRSGKYCLNECIQICALQINGTK